MRKRLPHRTRLRRGALLAALLGCAGCGSGASSEDTPGIQLEVYATTFCTTGKGPVALHVVDLNQDQLSDVLVVNGLANTLSVFLQEPGSGWKSVADKTYDTGRSPSAVTAADIDGDNLPDVLVANAGDDSVSSFLNQKLTPGVLQPDRVYGNIPTPIAIAADDVNGDKMADAVVASGGDFPLTMLRNDGAGLLLASPLAGGKYLYGVALTQLLTGARPDLVTVSAGDDNVRVLVNDGSGGYGGGMLDVRATWKTPVAVAAGILVSNQGKDLVVANYNSDVVTLLVNNGAYGFEERSFPTGHHPSAVAVGSLDSTAASYPQIVVASDDGVELFLGDSRGDFDPAVNRDTGAPLRLSVAQPSAVGVLEKTVGMQNQFVVADRENDQLRVYSVRAATP